MIQHSKKMPNWSKQERDCLSLQIGTVLFYYSVFCLSGDICICVGSKKTLKKNTEKASQFSRRDKTFIWKNTLVHGESYI